MDKETGERHNRLCEEKKSELAAKGITGAWMSEPNRVNWQHKGLDCMMIRHYELLHWCGYVGVKPGHLAHGKGYDDVSVDIHGGLTYSEKCGNFICHEDPTGEENTWWLGFDTCHLGDTSPGMMLADALMKGFVQKQGGEPLALWSSGNYRDVDFVTSETNILAEQLANG